MKYLLLTVLLCLSSLTQAVLKIEITEGMEGAMPIAVVPFKWNGGNKLDKADVSAIVTTDLARSGSFAPLAEKSMVTVRTSRAMTVPSPKSCSVSLTQR